MYRAIALAYTDRFYSDDGAVDTYNSRPALDSGSGHAVWDVNDRVGPMMPDFNTPHTDFVGPTWQPSLTAVSTFRQHLWLAVIRGIENNSDRIGRCRLDWFAEIKLAQPLSE